MEHFKEAVGTIKARLSDWMPGLWFGVSHYIYIASTAFLGFSRKLLHHILMVSKAFLEFLDYSMNFLEPAQHANS